MSSFAESDESNRHGPGGEERISVRGARDSTDLHEAVNLRSKPEESAGPTGWLYGLNAFLERAFREADRDTGC